MTVAGQLIWLDVVLGQRQNALRATRVTTARSRARDAGLSAMSSRARQANASPSTTSASTAMCMYDGRSRIDTVQPGAWGRPRGDDLTNIKGGPFEQLADAGGARRSSRSPAHVWRRPWTIKGSPSSPRRPTKASDSKGDKLIR